MTIQIKNAQNNFEQITLLSNVNKLGNESTANYNILQSTSISTTSNFIYVTENNKATEVIETPLKTSASELNDVDNEEDFYASFPLFFQGTSIILIPKKVKRCVERLPKRILDKIDKNKSTAVEKCLLCISNLTSTLFTEKKSKSLSSIILHEQLKNGNDNTFNYKNIIKALTYSTNSTGSTNGIISIKKNEFGYETYQEGVESKSYILNDAFHSTGLVDYIIKNRDILQKRNKFFYTQLKKANENVIAKNLIGLYPKIDLPKYEDLLFEARKLIKAKYKNKKGRTLTFLNKHNKMYYKDATTRSFVEENLKLYDYLTKRGFMIPVIGDEKSGGRVVDSFTLMPSWIRKLIKIEGESTVEIDFKAFHPNIAMSLYDGSKKHLTHTIVAEELNKNLNDVKINHLSYFNETVSGMKRNILYKYYNENESLMNKAIINEKLTSLKKHNITSIRMFKKEVEIMTECIKQLNSRGIYVGYVYDALFCKKSDAEIVKEIMDKVVLEFNVFTSASYN